MKRLKKWIKKLLGLYQEDIDDLKKRGVKIGNNVDIINSKIDYHHGFLLSIGNNVTITNATILCHDASTKKFIGKTKIGRVEIGDNVFIGLGVIVLPNTKIGSNVIIGAGSVVTGNIEGDGVYVGNPLRKISSFKDYIDKNKQNMTDENTFDYENKDEKVRQLMAEKIKMGQIYYDE